LSSRPSPRSPLTSRSLRATVLIASAALLAPAGVPAASATSTQAPASAQTATATAASAAQPSPDKQKRRFPGHRPGRVLLGMSCGVMCDQKIPQLGRNFGVHRWYKKWGNWHGIAEAIRADRRNHRRPWISIEGPNRGASTGWRDVGRGRYDHDIRELARTLKANDRRPIFISFDHEPSNKDSGSQPGAWWARGYNHFYDVLKRAHALRHVAVPPIMADWMFNKYNHEDNPSQWLRPGVLNRAPFLAVDVYQNDSGKTFGRRLPRIAHWLARHGHPHMMLGVGECGATKMYRNTTPVKWLNRSLRWAAHHPGRVAVVSYFNSTAYSRDRAYWPLDESAHKMRVYKRWLRTHPFVSRVR
jgi:hypothetical protein